MTQFAAPDFIRRLVAEGVQSNMPSGLVVQRVHLRAGTLSAIAVGSDMIRVTFPELAMQLLGNGVKDSVKDMVKAIFSRAEVANSAEILEELEHTHDGMPLLSMQDNAAKMAVGRLKDRMGEILGGQLPECPVTMEPIDKKNVRILKCCTAVLDAKVIERCKGVCPLCRALLVVRDIVLMLFGYYLIHFQGLHAHWLVSWLAAVCLLQPLDLGLELLVLGLQVLKLLRLRLRFSLSLCLFEPGVMCLLQHDVVKGLAVRVFRGAVLEARTQQRT